VVVARTGQTRSVLGVLLRIVLAVLAGVAGWYIGRAFWLYLMSL